MIAKATVSFNKVIMKEKCRMVKCKERESENLLKMLLLMPLIVQTNIARGNTDPHFRSITHVTLPIENLVVSLKQF